MTVVGQHEFRPADGVGQVAEVQAAALDVIGDFVHRQIDRAVLLPANVERRGGEVLDALLHRDVEVAVEAIAARRQRDWLAVSVLHPALEDARRGLAPCVIVEHVHQHAVDRKPAGRHQRHGTENPLLGVHVERLARRAHHQHVAPRLRHVRGSNVPVAPISFMYRSASRCARAVTQKSENSMRSMPAPKRESCTCTLALRGPASRASSQADRAA